MKSRSALVASLAVITLVAAIVVSSAAAHKGLFFSDTVRELAVEDGTTSYAAYGTLAPRRSKAAITVRLRKGELLHVELLLPDRPTERALPRARRPRISVSWPGGRTALQPLARIGRFDEPFTGTSYLRIAALDRPAPVDGRYRIEVRGTKGRFVIAPGTVERFGARDLIGARDVIRRVRAWYRAP